MDESISLSDAIQGAVLDWLAENGGGFPTAYVLALDYVESSGESRLLVSEMDNQRSRQSLGLVAELEELYRLEAREAWAMSRCADLDFEDEEED